MAEDLSHELERLRAEISGYVSGMDLNKLFPTFLRGARMSSLVVKGTEGGRIADARKVISFADEAIKSLVRSSGRYAGWAQAVIDDLARVKEIARTMEYERERPPARDRGIDEDAVEMYNHRPYQIQGQEECVS